MSDIDPVFLNELLQLWINVFVGIVKVIQGGGIC